MDKARIQYDLDRYLNGKSNDTSKILMPINAEYVIALLNISYNPLIKNEKIIELYKDILKKISNSDMINKLFVETLKSKKIDLLLLYKNNNITIKCILTKINDIWNAENEANVQNIIDNLYMHFVRLIGGENINNHNNHIENNNNTLTDNEKCLLLLIEIGVSDINTFISDKNVTVLVFFALRNKKNILKCIFDKYNNYVNNPELLKRVIVHGSMDILRLLMSYKNFNPNIMIDGKYAWDITEVISEPGGIIDNTSYMLKELFKSPKLDIDLLNETDENGNTYLNRINLRKNWNNYTKQDIMNFLINRGVK